MIRPGSAALVSLTSVLLASCGFSDTPISTGGSSSSSSSSSSSATLTIPDWASVTALGGDTTNTRANETSSGFDTPAPNLTTDDLATHNAGDRQFNAAFITAPSTDFPAQDGLGPAFNNSACENCHALDGRASYTVEAMNAAPGTWTKLGSEAGVFLRTSIQGGDGDCPTPSGANHYCAPEAVPGFTTQLFHRGVLALRPDSPFSGQADVYVSFETSTVTYADGTTETLYKPVFQIRNPYDNPGEVPAAGVAPVSRLLQDDVALSPRMSMPMFGLGLLEAIPDADILALADPDDADQDGISGRANFVYDPVKAAQGDPAPRSLGRFGWKANTPSVLVQAAGAYQGDIGITNYLFPAESLLGTPLYDTYRAANPGDDGQASQGYEVGEDVVKEVAFYSNTLAVPARRNVGDSAVQHGAALFVNAGCAACHHPDFVTGSHPGIWGPGGMTTVSEVEGQHIYPFTDMLLHDMGENLADHRTDYGATGREWKTRPLWGVGLAQTVNGLAGFLHDGRARTLPQAILWHGGEAETAKENFRTMSASDRAALISFLQSL